MQNKPSGDYDTNTLLKFSYKSNKQQPNGHTTRGTISIPTPKKWNKISKIFTFNKIKWAGHWTPFGTLNHKSLTSSFWSYYKKKLNTQ